MFVGEHLSLERESWAGVEIQQRVFENARYLSVRNNFENEGEC